VLANQPFAARGPRVAPVLLSGESLTSFAHRSGTV